MAAGKAEGIGFRSMDTLDQNSITSDTSTLAVSKSSKTNCLANSPAKELAFEWTRKNTT
jgi:hypothetical protein